MTSIELDLNAVRQNLQTFATILGGEHKIIPVLKCDAYGLGIVSLAKALVGSSVSIAAVANVAEATILRQSKYRGNVMIFAPVSSLSEAEIDECVKHQFSPTISSLNCVTRLKSYPQAHNLSLHLNIETGMHRYGAEPNSELLALKNLPLSIESVYSHLPRQFDQEDSDQRVANFRTVAKGLRLPCHIYRTSNALTLQTKRLKEFDYTRVGLGLYGINPSGTASGVATLTPAIRVHSSIACIREVLQGMGAGYDHDFVAKRDTRLAVIPVGYFHGLPLSASGKLRFLINGIQVPQVGQIGMDATLVDVTEVSQPRLGDEIVLFDGSTNAMRQWCEASKLSAWEVLTGLAKASKDIRCNAIKTEDQEMSKHA